MTSLHDEVSAYFAQSSGPEEAASLYRRLLSDARVMSLGDAWLVSGFDEILTVIGSTAASVDPAVTGALEPLAAVPTLSSALGLALPMRDGADHRRLRQLADLMCTPSRVAAAQQAAADVIDVVVPATASSGRFDVVGDLTHPVAVAVCSSMLGLGPSERGMVSSWATTFRDQLESLGQSAPDSARLETVVGDVMAFVVELCIARDRSDGDDLLSDLMAAQRSGLLSFEEVAAFVLMVFLNGLETLSTGLSLAVWHLLQRPEHLQHLAVAPRSAEVVFDECLRLSSPIRATARSLTDHVDVGGHRLPSGAMVVLFYAAANRDPLRFAEPDRLDPTRVPGRHLAFGAGAHACAGNALALAAGGLVLERVARRCRSLRTEVTASSANWGGAASYVALRSLPVTYSAVPLRRSHQAAG